MTSLCYPSSIASSIGKTPTPSHGIFFKVHGQTLSDLVIYGDTDKFYPSGSRLGTVASWGKLMAPLSIQKRGTNYRLGNRFVKGHAGGIPKLLPSTDLPITTQAERDLFSSLIDQYKTRRGKVDYMGMKAAFNAAFYSQVQPGQQSGPPDPQSMIFTKSTKHLKHYYQQLDRSARVRENEAFNHALSIIGTSSLQGQQQMTLKQSIMRASSKRQRHENTDQQVAVASPMAPSSSPLLPSSVSLPSPPTHVSSPNLPLLPSTSQPQTFFSMACAAVSGVINMVTSPPKALKACMTEHVEGEGQGGAQLDSYMCNSCLLLAGHVTYKYEHSKKSGRGVCPALSQPTAKKEVGNLKEAAQKAMYTKNHVNRSVVKHFSCPEYLAFLAK